ncbi:MAG TPA: preprotein translocase subunit SecY [Clostridiaceae bacterium]|nr:preprotein translocase subunit SecY [Clostridiaceae bacterium]
MGGVLQTLRNAWNIRDLRKRIIFTVLMLIVFRLGSFIPVPWINAEKFSSIIKQGGQLFTFLDIIAGGALSNVTIFAMSIQPYINSSIIMQLLTIAIPQLEKLAKEGEEGRKKLAQYTRYGTVVLAFLQATALYFGMRSAVTPGSPVLSYITITFAFTAGTAFLMWLGEQITEHGIGNGISMLIFAGIVSRAPQAVIGIIQLYIGQAFGTGIIGILSILIIIAIFVIVIAAVIWVQEAERRIPIQYAKRIVGRRVYGGQSTHLPIKVNMAGVLPIIFAMSIMAFPSTIVSLFAPNSTNKFVLWIKDAQQTVFYAIIYAFLIIFFTFFYTMTQFNPIEIANNMKKNGGFIPGIRPGKPTSDYISKVLNRITWFGGLFLAAITLLPNLLGVIFRIQGIWFSGSALLILVGVAMEVIRQIEAHMIMRNYKGFLE